MIKHFCDLCGNPARSQEENKQTVERCISSSNKYSRAQARLTIMYDKSEADNSFDNLDICGPCKEAMLATALEAMTNLHKNRPLSP